SAEVSSSRKSASIFVLRGFHKLSKIEHHSFELCFCHGLLRVESFNALPEFIRLGTDTSQLSAHFVGQRMRFRNFKRERRTTGGVVVLGTLLTQTQFCTDSR